MTNLESLRSLQKRIREAKGADCILDTDILVALLGEYEGELWDRQGNPLTLDPDGLGPCVALMREVLPGWYWHKNGFGFSIGKYVEDGFCPQFSAVHLANDCLTFLDAIFSAAIAQEEEAKHTEKAG